MKAVCFFFLLTALMLEAAPGRNHQTGTSILNCRLVSIVLTMTACHKLCLQVHGRFFAHLLILPIRDTQKDGATRCILG